MANKYIAASAAIGTSGAQARVQKITMSGTHATAIGTVTILTGGAGGTTQAVHYIQPGDTVQITVPYTKADYITLSNASVVVEFAPGKDI